MMRAAACFAAVATLSGCARPATVWRSPDAATWSALRQRLDVARAARPSRPWAAGVRVTLREPRSGRVVDGRGAIAAAPGRAVRMILTGGAGSTMLDAWGAADRWRVSVPALAVIRQGGTEEAPDLPVGFLRRWFLSPLEGTLLAAAEPSPGESLWVLRAPGSVVELRASACERGQRLVAARRVGARTERVDECRAGGPPRAGDMAEYRDLASGLRVDVLVESVSDAGPDPEAFVEPTGAEAGP